VRRRHRQHRRGRAQRGTTLELDLDAAALERIEAAVPPDAASGARYPEPQKAQLDSEA
jgi:hypothetical protein